jgi:hypothetical protein
MSIKHHLIPNLSLIEVLPNPQMAPRRNTRTFQSQAHTTPSAERQRGVQGQAPGQEDQEDQEVSQQGGESQVGARQAPPPPAIDLVQALNN